MSPCFQISAARSPMMVFECATVPSNKSDDTKMKRIFTLSNTQQPSCDLAALSPDQQLPAGYGPTSETISRHSCFASLQELPSHLQLRPKLLQKQYAETV